MGENDVEPLRFGETDRFARRKLQIKKKNRRKTGFVSLLPAPKKQNGIAVLLFLLFFNFNFSLRQLGFLFSDLPCQSCKKHRGNYRREYVYANEVEPNSVKREAPKRAEQSGGEDKCRANRKDGSLKWLSDRAEIALRRNADPAEQVCKAEKPDRSGGYLKKTSILRVYKPRRDNVGEEEQN